MKIRSLIGYVAGFNAATRSLIFSERDHALSFGSDEERRAFMRDVSNYGQAHQFAGCRLVSA